jgi:hypothetical protein
LQRFADLAHQRGLRLYQDGPRWYCSSASDAGGCHYVTGFSCDCRGFIQHRRCTHHALLLERLGWLPELEAETPAPSAAPQSCFWCQGTGRIPNDQHERFDRCDRCDRCAGVRPTSPAIRLQGRPAVEIAAEAA